MPIDTAFTNVLHPTDLKYQRDRRRQIDECLKMNEQDLDRQLRYMLQETPNRDESGMTSKIIGEIYAQPFTPRAMKGILDSTSGTTGSVLIRQDLEPVLYSIFVKKFPVFDRISKGPSNGLVHAATQITSPDSGALGSSVITEIGTVPYSTGAYNRLTFPIAVFATGRGVTIKESAAVAQGGSPYDPSKTEMSNGMLKLALDMQYMFLQGNASNAGGTLTQEAGLYNANGIDGFRGTLGSVSAFSANNAIQADISSLNITESFRFGATKGANAGGDPSLAFMSLNSKQAFDDEQNTNVRYDGSQNMTELIPGVRVSKLTYSNGELAIVALPGNTMGTYTRTSDSALVEDMYFVDERALCIRWLYSENFTVLQIPSGVDGVLSERWIIFMMAGLEIAAPSFMGKIRRLAS